MIQFAYAADGTTAAGAGNMTSTIIMIVVMIAIFYFLLIRPENKRKKQAEEMRNSLNPFIGIVVLLYGWKVLFCSYFLRY